MNELEPGQPGTLSPREEKIVEMLRSRKDVILGAESGNGRDGGYSLSYGDMFTPAFRELERLLEVMRAERPKQYRNVVARYVDCDRRPLEVPFHRRKVSGGLRFDFRLPPHTELADDKTAPAITDEKTARVLVYQWPEWVRASVVRDGVAWLAASFRGVPAVPREFREAA